ncbi:MAG TPA: ParA family protein [Alphaproteobacteria bacterium]|nr:ParA family protein [Alphaproteobacteria bacterium]
MLSILVANIKGGCGKTTLATNIAGHFAAQGHRTVLADADRQHSSLGWLLRRPSRLPAIVGRDWSRELDDLPKGTARLVIDAPAALKAKQVEELLRLADMIVLPVLPSAFDEAATLKFLARIEEMKAIRKQRAEVAIVGNRLRPRTRAADRLDQFLAEQGRRVVARLRDSQAYPEGAAAGTTLFDLKGAKVRPLLEDWQPLTARIDAAG